MQFDLLIAGGEVRDPGSQLRGDLDVGIADGKIAAIAAGLPRENARTVLDARGLIVTPGLIDLHTHVYWGGTYWGVEPDPIAARTGVTTWLDVGSAGAYNFPGFRRWIVEPSRARVYALLNASSIGLVGPTYEFANPDYLDLALAARMTEQNRDRIVGIKARIDALTTRGTGLLALERARALADQVQLPLMVHIGRGPPALRDIFTHLRPGDILTHCFTGHDNRIIDTSKAILPYVRELWDRGLVMDIGHGAGSFSVETARAMIDQKLMPDVISTDIHQLSIQGPMFDMPTTMAKFLALGMTLDDVIERSTSRPARAVGLKELGALRVGGPADIAVLSLRKGAFTFYDVFKTPFAGSVQIDCVATIVAGQILPPAPERALHDWADDPQLRAAVGPRP